MIETPKYQVPALEKGLDILECLAARGIPMTQAQIARALNRGPNELFRMLVCLEQRGYVRREPVSGAYSLTLRLFTLSHTHTPLEGLLRAAGPPMRDLATTIGESCHLGVLHGGDLLVIAQEESSRQLRLSIEVGATFPLLQTASGRLLLANLAPDEREAVLHDNADYVVLGLGERVALAERLAAIRAQGYEEAYAETTEGVHDHTVLVGRPETAVQAALTIASLSRTRHARSADLVQALQRCAAEIAHAAGLLALNGEQL